MVPLSGEGTPIKVLERVFDPRSNIEVKSRSRLALGEDRGVRRGTIYVMRGGGRAPRGAVYADPW